MRRCHALRKASFYPKIQAQCHICITRFADMPPYFGSFDLPSILTASGNLPPIRSSELAHLRQLSIKIRPSRIKTTDARPDTIELRLFLYSLMHMPTHNELSAWQCSPRSRSALGALANAITYSVLPAFSRAIAICRPARSDIKPLSHGLKYSLWWPNSIKRTSGQSTIYFRWDVFILLLAST